MNTHKISVKFYIEKGHDIAPETWFRTFNTWISAHEGPDVLIDVADYSHVPNGPVTLLVGHQYDISIDDADGQRGLLYNRKQPTGGDFAQHLAAVIRYAGETCHRIESDPVFGDQVAFKGGELRLVLNDRLNAPNAEETLADIQEDLNGVLNRLYAGAAVTVNRREDPKARFTLDIRAEGDWPIDKVRENL